jgi:hypothetical protein
MSEYSKFNISISTNFEIEPFWIQIKHPRAINDKNLSDETLTETDYIDEIVKLEFDGIKFAGNYEKLAEMTNQR